VTGAAADQRRRSRSGVTRVGTLRPSQLLFIFGVGAVADLPHLSVLLMGLDFWDTGRAERVGEERLLAALRAKFGAQVETLRTPPYLPETPDPFDAWSRVGVPVGVFPQWLRCTNPRCRRLAPIDLGLFQLKVNQFRPDQAHYEHGCTTRGRAPAAVPARFLVACRNGHLDDFPWREFCHRGPACASPNLKLLEFGATGEVADLRVRCDACEASRAMTEAFGREAETRLPRCRGRRPHLADFEESPCDALLRTVALGASNLWFPVTLSVLSIPSAQAALAQRVEELWTHLEDVPSEDALVFALRHMTQLAPLAGFEPAEIMAAVAARRSGGGGVEAVEDLRGPEWDVLSNPEQVPKDASEHFRLRVAELPDLPLLKGRVEQVVLAERLREVVALTGFTRIDSPGEPDAAGQPPPEVPLGRGAARWFPCTETRGEGIFLRFPLDEVGRWEQRVLGGERVEEFLRASSRGAGWSVWPGLRYVLLHTLSHALMREAALECGYGAASIRERLYADEQGPRNWAGILLYTAAPDSEGTLGGLVSLGKPEMLGRLLSEAVEQARLCSADPMCAEHAPGDGGALHGAACHACLFAAETSCERGNRFLDRSLLVDTFTVSGLGYFS
jgi:Domain of unknown function (DUF1998)